ncbi:ACT domain-containing protein [Burkholderia alba]|uniref:ACT domain-containing protein n=1 Tax=Burkholderia alba TaxID=2683677 RepID=UPI002B05DA3F|nr:ACT domain-containing protein [Burkholderia alba]
MSKSEADLNTLLRTMQPVLNPGGYVYASLPDHAQVHLADVIATFRECEGLTVVAAEAVAARHGWPVLFRAAWLTLTVHSDLQAVGLTAAFARALGAANISCNVLAAAYHDHVFVPFEDGERALEALVALQRNAASGDGAR